MIELLSKLIQMTNDDPIDLSTLQNFSNLATHIYSKDKSGKYLYCNDAMVHVAGVNKSSAIIGHTDFDLIWFEDAMYFRENDHQVISRRDSMIFIEPSLISTKNSYTKTHLLSYKKPLYSRSKKIIGIFGISIVSSIYEMYKKSSITAGQWKEVFNISAREYDCLYHLAYGKSAKQIARLLHISHRTVEEYLTSAKKKLKCTDRYQLIETIIDLGIL